MSQCHMSTWDNVFQHVPKTLTQSHTKSYQARQDFSNSNMFQKHLYKVTQIDTKFYQARSRPLLREVKIKTIFLCQFSPYDILVFSLLYERVCIMYRAYVLYPARLKIPALNEKIFLYREITGWTHCSRYVRAVLNSFCPFPKDFAEKL